MPKRKTLDDVKKVFAERGYTLVSTEYKNARTKLDAVCPKGHNMSISYDSFSRGSGCIKCAHERNAARSRLSYEQVKEFFEKEGYILLSEDYHNDQQKLKCVCPSGHETAISYNNFRNGRRCKKCSVAKRNRAQSLSYEHVRDAFIERGYELLSTEYTNAKTHLRCRCPQGHELSITYDSFKQGNGCAECAKEKRADKKRHSYDYVREYFQAEKYTLISASYKNSKSKLEYICPEGHRGVTTFGAFRGGRRCPICSKRKVAEEQRADFDYVKSWFENAGYIMLSKPSEYINNKTLLACICPEGHRCNISYSRFRGGRRCSVCSRRSGADKRRLSFSTVLSTFNEAGYTLLSSEDAYTTQYDVLTYKCPNGHIGKTTYTNFRSGRRCPVCFGGISRAELELSSFVATLVGKDGVVSNTRKVIPPLELDIYIPSKKVAIEYCGLYWHSEISGEKPRDYHRTKMDRCIDEGIRLITIFEDEYIERPEVVKSRIANALGCSTRRIYARDCELKEIDVVHANAFLYNFHLQGRSSAAVAFALFVGDEMVQVLTLGHLSRTHASIYKGKKVKMLELKRIASLPYVNVVGGASRLFKRAVFFARQNGFQYIKSYSDNRYASISSSVYDKLGFYLAGETRYTPHYVMGQKRLRNQSLRKTTEERELFADKTEWDLRKEQGYDRIWDCGHKTYLYKI